MNALLGRISEMHDTLVVRYDRLYHAILATVIFSTIPLASVLVARVPASLVYWIGGLHTLSFVVIYGIIIERSVGSKRRLTKSPRYAVVNTHAATNIIEEWCRQNTIGFWFRYEETLYFRDQRDKLLFLLHWSDHEPESQS